MHATLRVLAVVACAAVAAASVDFDSPLVDDALIARVNRAGGSWKAGPQPRFAEWTVGDLVRNLGAKQSAGGLERVAEVAADLPENFDWRNKSAVCTGPVTDQGECGSCWAVSSANAISSRRCLQGSSNGTYEQLAALDLVACDAGWFSGNNGCQGGQPSAAWSYAQQSGLVTEGCLPYLKSEGGPIPTCEKEPCMPPTFVDTPQCVKKCANGDSFQGDKNTIKSVYSVQASVQAIRSEIYTNGPVVAAFTVYNDFPAYKGGIYKVTPGASALGGHAVKIVGYGTENGEQYWTVQNSWTTNWGDAGYFKIGVEQCGISDNIVAGMA